MKINRIKHTRIVSFLSVILLLTGCGMHSNTVWTHDHLVTLYTIPRYVQVGENQVAFRVQDRDYRIVNILSAQMTLYDSKSIPLETIPLRPGPGRDWRGWFTLPKTGIYKIMLAFRVPSSNMIIADFLITVPDAH